MTPRRPGPGRDRQPRSLRRTRGSAQRRLARTIVLGAVVVAAGIGWLAVEFGMNTDELLDYALTSVMLVLAAVILALLGGALVLGIKRLLQRRR